MPLPTTGFKLHVDHSDNTHNFTTWDSGGANSGTPADGAAIQVCDELKDVSDWYMRYHTAPTRSPIYRSTSSPMLRGGAFFDGVDDQLVMTNAGGTPRELSFFCSGTSKSMFAVIHPTAITSNGGATAGNAYTDHCVVTEGGGFWGITLRNAGGGVYKAQGFNYAGAEAKVEVDISLDQTCVLLYQHDGTNISLSKNNETPVTVASGASGGLGNLSAGGAIGSGGGYYTGGLGEYGIYDPPLAGADLTAFWDYMLPRWVSGTALTKKYRIPTTATDGTQRRLYIWADTTMATTLISNQLVTASGGFFTHTDAGAVVGVSRPAALLGFGANEAIDAFGGPCWALGIEE